MTSGRTRKIVLGGLAAAVLAALSSSGMADDTVFEKKTPSDQNDIIHGGRGVSDRSAIAGVCSLLIPGIGQAVNSNPGKKVAVHLVIGLLPLLAYVNPVGAIFGLFHIWSAWDALIDRRGGYINGTVCAPVEWLDASANGSLNDPVC